MSDTDDRATFSQRAEAERQGLLRIINQLDTTIWVAAEQHKKKDAALAAANDEVERLKADAMVMPDILSAAHRRIAKLEAAVGRLVAVACGEVDHIYEGHCPDQISTTATDPKCPACRVIIAARAAAEQGGGEQPEAPPPTPPDPTQQGRNPMTNELWTQRDLARHYRVTVRTIRRWRKRGRLPEPVTGDGEHPRWNPGEFYIYRDVPGPKNNRDKSGHKRTNQKTAAQT